MDEDTTADGSPVPAYAVLPAEPELTAVRELLGGRHSVLDLGAGTGRLADPLAAAGHDVVAVDDSDAMLERVRRARPVRSRIEDLDLGETFDAVLLLSHLINQQDPRPLLASAARHLAADGVLVLQRLVPGHPWREGSSRAGPVEISLSRLIVALPRVAARTTFRLGAQVWHQDWVLVERDDADVEALLEQAGLRLVSPSGAWGTAALEPGPDARR